MKHQPLWRGALAITEGVTGAYTVHASTRFEHGQEGAPQVYANLTWPEACDLVATITEGWHAERSKHWQRLSVPDPAQLRIFDLP